MNHISEETRHHVGMIATFLRAMGQDGLAHRVERGDYMDPVHGETVDLRRRRVEAQAELGRIATLEAEMEYEAIHGRNLGRRVT
jgi:hypothetical protein